MTNEKLESVRRVMDKMDFHPTPQLVRELVRMVYAERAVREVADAERDAAIKRAEKAEREAAQWAKANETLAVAADDEAHKAKGRAEKAEAERDEALAMLADLREAGERLADAIAYERLTHDGDVADIPGPGALGRLGTAERLAREALADTAATAEAYTRRVRARALREAAQRLLARHLPGGGAVMWGPAESSWRERGAIWLRAEAERIEGGS